MTPYEVYTTYLAMKKHFCDLKYDYFRYHGKTRSSVASFNRRKDRYFFEKMSRKLTDDEIKLYFIANFVSTDNPSSIWVGEIIRSGEKHFQKLVKTHQSMSYIFTQECQELFSEYKLGEIFSPKNGHPPILKKYLSGETSIETLVILNSVFNYSKDLDKRLTDPVWEMISMKLNKYRPFLNIDTDRYKKVLRNIVYV